MSYAPYIISRDYESKEYLITANYNGEQWVWHHKRGSAHQFSERAAAEAIAFLCGGEVESREE